MQTEKRTRIVFALTLALAACGNAPKKSGATGGEGGDETGGDTGSTATGGTKPASNTGGSTGTGGSTATGGSSATGGSGGAVTTPPDASAGTGGGAGGGGNGDAAAGGAGGGGVSAGHTGALGWVEAEATTNMLFGGAKVGTCGAGTCMSTEAIKEGVECCSAGKKVSQLLRGKGGVVFQNVMAPSDGMYDVSWWFHCGKNDNFGDANCGGAPHTPSGCRPHVFEINGTKFPKVYHFPCFPGSWGEIHASTVTMPLKMGMNSIKVQATPGRDAADLDAIEVFPAGKGFPPTIVGTNN